MRYVDARPALVIGSTLTPNHLSDLTAFAYDVADRLRLPAVVSTWADDEIPDFISTWVNDDVPGVGVAEYAAVVLCDNWGQSLPASLIVGWAAANDVPVFDSAELYRLPETDICVSCLTRDDGEAQPEPKLVAGTWTVAVCKGCAAQVRKAERARQRTARKLVAAAR